MEYTKTIRILLKEGELKHPTDKKIKLTSNNTSSKIKMKILFCKFQTVDKKFTSENRHKLYFKQLSNNFESRCGFDYDLHIEDLKYKDTVYTCIFPINEILLTNKINKTKKIEYFIPELYDIVKNVKIELFNLDILLQIKFLVEKKKKRKFHSLNSYNMGFFAKKYEVKTL
jgi:hypothetical protein